HILLEYTCPGQQTVWTLAKELLAHQKSSWIHPSLGSILACGAVTIRDENGKCMPGESRLLRIPVSESVHLIWKLRNERVINDTEPVSTERITKR
ncbi:hypothetical protein C8R42DRAFT_582956, partial [Lentinula raphanica]